MKSRYKGLRVYVVALNSQTIDIARRGHVTFVFLPRAHHLEARHQVEALAITATITDLMVFSYRT